MLPLGRVGRGVRRLCPGAVRRWGIIDSWRVDIEEHMCYNRVMDKEMIARVVSEVERNARSVGFGQVTIVIEKGRPRWIESGTANG